MSGLLAEAGPEPHPDDHPTQAAYELAWYTWRAIRRDGYLTPAELAAQWDVTKALLRSR